MNKLQRLIILSLCILFWMPVIAYSETYFLRADGSGNKAAATGSGSGSCAAAATAMSIATHDGETYAAGDTIYLCDDGGVFRDQLDIPSSGSAGSVITYVNASGDSPVISGADLKTVWAAATSGTVTIENFKLSSIDGTAFIDLGSSVNIAQYISGTPLLTIADSAGAEITGYIKAAGTGETYDAEEVPNPTMEDADPPTLWNAVGGATLARVADERTGGAGSYSISCFRGTSDTAAWDGTISPSVGGLFRLNLWVKSPDMTYNDVVGLYDQAFYYEEIGQTWTEVTHYINYVATNSVTLRAKYASYEVRFDDVSLKQVLTPSTSGVTITSTADSTTYNWATQAGGFDYHDENGYTYTVTGGGAISNLYSLACTTEPLVVLLDGVEIDRGVGSDHTWWWIDDVLYLQDASGDPDVTGAVVEAAARDKALYVNGLSYVTFEGIDFQVGNNPNACAGGTACGGSDQGVVHVNGSDNIIFTDCPISYGIAHGAYVVDSSDVNFNGGAIHHNDGSGVLAYHGAGSSGNENYIQKLSIYNNGWMGVDIIDNYWIVQESKVYDNGQNWLTGFIDPRSTNTMGLQFVGVHVYDAADEGWGQYNIVRRNQIYGTLSNRADGEGLLFDDNSQYNIGRNNIGWDNDSSAFAINAGTDNKLYNNTSYDNCQNRSGGLGTLAGCGEIRLTGTVTNSELKNNIGHYVGATWNGISISASAAASEGLDITNNIWYSPSASNFYSWDGTPGNVLGTWNALTGVGTDINSDPLLHDPANGKLWPKLGSPAMHGAAYLVGYEDRLRPESTWPDDVTTVQDILSIGAYAVYRGAVLQ